MAAKYSYILSNEELSQAIKMIPDAAASESLNNQFMNDPILFRAKLAIPRFFPNDMNNYFILIGMILQKRLSE